MQKICAFTGHRPQKFHFGFDEQHKDCIKIKNALKEQIIFLIEEGYTHFISGMALGADTWAAEAVLELRKAYTDIILECALPCVAQAAKWSHEQQNRYINILAKSNILNYVNHHYSDTCMLDRNRYMVEKADAIIAVLNEQESNVKECKSGTLYTINYALKLNKRVIVINSDTAMPCYYIKQADSLYHSERREESQLK